jgi:glycosyltransferase involved in cell wall biosynthesis
VKPGADGVPGEAGVISEFEHHPCRSKAGPGPMIPGTSRPRVLMVTEKYLPDPGGTERQLRLLARELRIRKVEVEIVTPRRLAHYPMREVIDGTLVHRLSFPRIRYVAACGILLHLGWFLLRHGWRFDVFHVHTIDYGAVVATMLGRLLRRRVVLKAAGWWELTGVLSPARRARAHGRLLLAVLRRANAWVAVSRELARAMGSAGVPASRVYTLPNGVDLARFAPGEKNEARRRLGLDEDRPRTLFIGRLVPEKDVTTLLKAWRHVIDVVPEAVLDIVGSGPLEGDLRAQANDLGVEKQVFFHGEQSEVVPYLQAADCFVLPSLVEGMSNALLEAMAVGLPVVATRIEGNERLLEDGVTGRLVLPHDAEALARALVDILQDVYGALSLGRRARKLVLERFGMAGVADAYLALYAGQGRK